MSQPGYLIAQINVKDYPQYISEYGLPVFALGSEHGAEFLVATPDAKTLEGEWSGNWTVVIRFPTVESALTFYKSAEYAPLLDVLINKLSNGGNLIIAEGFDSSVIPAVA